MLKLALVVQQGIIKLQSSKGVGFILFLAPNTHIANTAALFEHLLTFRSLSVVFIHHFDVFLFRFVCFLFLNRFLILYRFFLDLRFVHCFEQ